MPRAPRVHIEGALYFVSLEGPNRLPIFKDKLDYDQYIDLLNQYKSEYQFKLFSYALLPNRIHLLIEVGEEYPISQIMQRITPLYTKYFNDRYNRKGPLFHKRFRSVIVEKEAYLPRLTRFVHLAPVWSHVASRAEDHPRTSLPSFTNGTSESDAEAHLSMSAEIEEVLNRLVGPHNSEAYQSYVASADERELEFLQKNLFRGSWFGSTQFVTRVKRRIKESAEKVTHNGNDGNGSNSSPAGDHSE